MAWLREEVGKTAIYLEVVVYKIVVYYGRVILLLSLVCAYCRAYLIIELTRFAKAGSLRSKGTLSFQNLSRSQRWTFIVGTDISTRGNFLGALGPLHGRWGALRHLRIKLELLRRYILQCLWFDQRRI